MESEEREREEEEAGRRRRGMSIPSQNSVAMARPEGLGNTAGEKDVCYVVATFPMIDDRKSRREAVAQQYLKRSSCKRKGGVAEQKVDGREVKRRKKAVRK